MIRISSFVAPFAFATAILLAGTAPAVAQVQNYKPVTQEMLLNPSPDDWLMFSRTYDAQSVQPSQADQ